MYKGKARVVFRCLAIFTLVLSSTAASGGNPAYSVRVIDVDGNRDYQLVRQGFHFGSLIVTDVGTNNRLVLRPHPDLDAPDGWGSSLFVAPFLAGADSGGVEALWVRRTRRGIAIVAIGDVNSPDGGGFGTWFFAITLRYDPQTETISGSNGVLGIWLDDTLATADRDLNLYKLSTNYLHHVPLQSGGIGDTGDISEVVYLYDTVPDPRDFTWVPPDLPAHFPFDLTSFLSVNAVGTVNDVDTLALGEGFQINVTPKPTLEVTLAALQPDNRMIAGMIWDTTQATNFAADNVGVTPLVPKGTTEATFLFYGVDFHSTPPAE